MPNLSRYPETTRETVCARGQVLGTWKVLVGMIVIPILHLSYTAAAFTLVSKPFAVLYFFFMPFVSATSVVAANVQQTEAICNSVGF